MPTVDRYDRPTYSLRLLQRLIRQRRYLLAYRAVQDARRLGFRDAIADCVCGLNDIPVRDGGNFHKSSIARRPPVGSEGLWHDVYFVVYEGVQLYIKLQLSPIGQAVIISFHENTNYRVDDA